MNTFRCPINECGRKFDASDIIDHFVDEHELDPRDGISLLSNMQPIE